MDGVDAGDVLRWGGVALAVLLSADPVLAQEFDSTTEELIRTLNAEFLYLAIPIAVLVEVILLYTVVRFRNADEPTPTTENRGLEITWTVATALVLLFVGLASYQVMTDPYVTTPHGSSVEVPGDAVEIRVTGQQWQWDVAYPGENVSIRDAGTIYVPTNRSVHFVVTSRDVIHSLHVPGLALKADAIPGERHVIRTVVTEEGTYPLYCAEYCGVGHPNMTATVKAVSPSEYRDWLASQRNDSDQSNGSADLTRRKRSAPMREAAVEAMRSTATVRSTDGVRSSDARIRPGRFARRTR